MLESVFIQKIKNIKSKPHWSVIIRPKKFIENRIDKLENLKWLMTANRISLRGWDYPYFDPINNLYGNDYIGSYTEFRQIKESWKFYQSGQFENYFAFWEDLYPDKNLLINQAKSSLLIPHIIGKKIAESTFLEVDSTVYRIAEIFLFFSYVGNFDMMGENLLFEIGFNSTEGRVLFIWESGRELHDKYQCSVNNFKITLELTKTKLIGECDEIIVDVSKQVFERFGWGNVDSSLLHQIVNNFKNKKIK